MFSDHFVRLLLLQTFKLFMIYGRFYIIQRCTRRLPVSRSHLAAGYRGSPYTRRVPEDDFACLADDT